MVAAVAEMCFSTVLEDKFGIKVSAGLVFSEASLLGCRRSLFSLSSWAISSVHVYVLMLFTRPTGSGSILMTSFNYDYFSTHPHQVYAHSEAVLGFLTLTDEFGRGSKIQLITGHGKDLGLYC